MRQSGGTDHPVLAVEVVAGGNSERVDSEAEQVLTRMLGTAIDLSHFYTVMGTSGPVGDLVRRFRGVKPPRFPTYFEALGNGFLFQQISLLAGMTLMNKFVRAFGRGLVGSRLRAFPVPEDIAPQSIDSLRSLGLSRQKAKAFVELASSLQAGTDFSTMESMSDEEAMHFLCQVRGVGRWTAQYVLLRGLGRLHSFPVDDVGARNKLWDVLGLESAPDRDQTARLVQSWYPYGGMIYFHLLLNGLAQRGLVTPGV